MAAHTTSDGDRRIVGTYPYHDEGGSLLYEVVRFEPKGFAQRRPDGKGGHVWGLNGTRRVLYRLPELINAAPHTTIYIAEGEKDCDRLADLGLVSTTSGAAGSWRPEFAEYFVGREVVVLPDSDGPGLDHADRVARSLHQVARRVRLVWLPGPEKSDVSDWLDAGHSVEELLAIVARTPDYEPPTETSGTAPTKVIEFPSDETAKPLKKSAAVRLVEVLPDDTVLFHAPDGVEYAVVTVNAHRETLKAKSSAFRKYLARLFYLTEGKAPSSQALHDAVNLICAQALYDGHEQEVYLRTAPREGGGFWLDLCDSTWSAIEVTASGWCVVENPPVRFRRAPGMLALPVPQGGGSLDEVGEFARRLERLERAALLDGAGNTPCMLLFAQEAEDSDQIGHLGAVDHIGSRNAGDCHAHVERAVALEREAALGLVDLHRGHADIEHDAVETAFRRELGEIGEFRVMKDEPTTARFDQILAAGNGVGIAVERNDIGTLAEDGRGVTTRAEGTVENDFAGLGVKRLQDLREKNRNVANRSAIGIGKTFAKVRRHSVSPSF